MSPIFDWLVDLVEGIGDAIGSVFGGIGDAIASAIFDTFLQWIYGIIYNAIADFFTMMGQLGAQIFDLPWIQAFIRLFSLFAWALFAAGTVVAIFDVAVEYQSGRANIKSCAINIKEYLARNNMTQRQFFLGLIEAELDRDQAERNSIREGDPDESVSEKEETEARDHDGNEPALPEDPDSGAEPEGSADPQDYEQTM